MQREDREKIFSKRVRAGKRTYFFDVRATRSNDYYLTITESRRQQRDGDFVYDKSKMFIYKEDFNKFVDALQETVDHIKTELNPDFDYDQFSSDSISEQGGNPPAPTTPISKKDEVSVELPNTEDDEFGNSDLKWE